MTRFAQVSLVAIALVFAPGCKSSEAPAATVEPEAEAEVAVNGELGTEVFVEEQDDGSVAWRIDPDGQVKAAVSAGTGARIKQDIAGSLIFKVDGGEPRTVPLVLDANTGLLVAAGPKLEADLTEVSYTLTVSGKPWSGVMHLPVGGTAALVAGGKVTAEAKLPDDAVGPHGGTIQVVGSDRLEMVADADSGDTRVYVLAADLQPVRVETRTLRMGFVAQTTTFVNFTPEPAGFYFIAPRATVAVLNPFRVTVALGFGGISHAAIWGYHPGIHIYAPTATVKLATAPRIRFVLKGGFDSGVDVYGRAHVKVVARADDDDHDHRKGNNGRHTGQDGTRDRDSGGFKDDNRHDSHRSKSNGGNPGNDSNGGGHSKGGGNDSKGGGHDSKAGGHSNGGGHDSKAGGNSNGGGHDSKAGGGSKSGGGAKSGGGGGGKSGGGGGGKSGGGKGGKK